MIDKSLNGINCGNIKTTVEQLNGSDNETTQSSFYNVTLFQTDSLLEETVCRAEIESQKLISTISGTMAPIGN